MQTPVVSVLVPVYNASLTLAHTARSILAQSFSDFELLLIDDGSTDGSLELCRSLAGTDARIRVLCQPNGGVSAARNLGLGEARGRYIAFIDADDIVTPDYLERLLEGMRPADSVLSLCAHARIRSYDDALATERSAAERLPAQQCAKRVLCGRFPISVCCCLLERARIGELRFPVGVRSNEDKDFLYRYLLANEGGTVAFSRDKLYGYLVREGSAARSAWNGSRDVILVADRLAELTARVHPEWRELAENARMTARFDTLKRIVRSGGESAEARAAFAGLKAELLALPYPRTGGRRLRAEYAALRLGEGCYRLLVRLYYGLVSDEGQFRQNERQTMRR